MREEERWDPIRDRMDREIALRKEWKKQYGTKILVAGVIVGVAAGIGVHIGYDKIFKVVVKDPKIINGPLGENAVKFIVNGKNMVGKTIIESKGFLDIPTWVGTFVDSMADSKVGNNICAEVLKNAPDIQKALEKTSPELLKELGIKITKF